MGLFGILSVNTFTIYLFIIVVITSTLAEYVRRNISSWNIIQYTGEPLHFTCRIWTPKICSFRIWIWIFILLYDMLTTKQLPGVIQIIYIKFNDHYNYTNLRSLKISMSNWLRLGHTACQASQIFFWMKQANGCHWVVGITCLYMEICFRKT